MAPPSGERETGETEPSTPPQPAREERFDPDIIASDRNRKQAVLYSLPFLALGVGNVILILSWGLEPLWAFALLPPILFTTFLTYLVFSTDFLKGR